MRAYVLILILCFAPLLAGCGQKEYKQPGYGVATVPYHEQSLQSLMLSRQYMAQGRYELAKQRLLLALAVERDAGMRARLSEELSSADKMIQTMR